MAEQADRERRRQIFSRVADVRNEEYGVMLEMEITVQFLVISVPDVKIVIGLLGYELLVDSRH
jgi:hypothetical protein